MVAAGRGDLARRLFCHVHGRAKSQSQFIPGRPYSFVAALETGRTSWTAVLDAVRPGPADDATAVTAAQLRQVVERLLGAGQWSEGDPAILIVCDAGYDVTRLAFVLADLPVELVGRIRSDRVLRLPAPPRDPHFIGRPPRHGGEFALANPVTWPQPRHTTTTNTTRYGTATAMSWDRLHPRLTHRAAWLDHQGKLPIIEGTLTRLEVERVPGTGAPQPVWLWSSATGAAPDRLDQLWQAFLRRFDLEHTFRMLKQTLGWTRPKLRTPQAPHAPSRRPLDLDRHRRPHPAPARPTAHQRPTTALGEARRAWPAHPRPRPPRVSEHPPGPRLPGQRTETHHTRPRTTTGLAQQPARHHPRRRQNDQTRENPRHPLRPGSLKNKLSACLRS